MMVSLFKNPYVLAVLVQFLHAVGFLLVKAACNQGMNVYIFVFYRQVVAALFMLPPAMYFERKSSPRLTFPIFCKIFGVASIGLTLALILMAVGVKYTSSTFAAASLNCLPVVTILISVLMRVEKFNVRKGAAMAKIAGIILCVGAVAVLLFYKGPHLNSPFSFHLYETSSQNVSSSRTWLKGGLLSVIAIFSWSLGLVFLGKITVIFPSKLILTGILCLISAFQSLIVAIIMERRPSEWKLTWNIGLLAVIFSGTVGTGLLFYLQALVIDKKGPVFLALYSPLSLIIAMICAFLLLDEPMNLASILGGVLSVCSLYSVLWAKRIEERKDAVATENVEMDQSRGQLSVEFELTDTKELQEIKEANLV